jgi:hypothetical protein
VATSAAWFGNSKSDEPFQPFSGLETLGVSCFSDALLLSLLMIRQRYNCRDAAAASQKPKEKY